MTIELGKLLDDFFDPQQWIRWRTSLIASAFAACIIYSILEVCTEWKSGWLIILAIGLFGVMCVAWFVGRSIYWHTGLGKCGVIFEQALVDANELSFIKREFEALVSSNGARLGLCLKILPEWLSSSPKRLQEFQEKYSIGTIVVVVISKSLQDPQKNHRNYRVSLDTEIEIDNALLSSCGVPLSALALHAPKPVSRQQILQNQVDELYDLLLFLFATKYINDNQIDYAVAFLQAFDRRFQDRGISSKANPRAPIRRMICSLAVKVLSSPPDEVIKIDNLAREIDKLRSIVEQLGEEYPWIRISYARACYLHGDRSTARTQFDLVVASGPNEWVCFATLSLAVLDLFDSKIKQSEIGFRSLLQDGSMSRFNMNDLIKFADLCKEKNEPNAIVLQIYYRSLLYGATPAADMMIEFWSWVNADKAREVFRKLVNDAKPMTQDLQKNNVSNAGRRKQMSGWKKRKK